MKGFASVVGVLACHAYNITILGGCAWLVWHGWSPWWFLFAICVLSSWESKEEA